MLRKLSIAAALASAAPAVAQAPDVDPIFARWSAPSSPGCAVAASRDGRTIVERSFGSADLEHDVPITPRTIFEAGSVSKQFTAAAVLLLTEEGKLALSDDVRRFVPELPDYGRTITIDQLISHTSGLRDWGVVSEIAGWPRGSRAYTPADVLDIIARQRTLNYVPGSEYAYTNSGYNLLALIVERVSGASLAAFTRDRFFVPLGMRSTSWRDDFRRIVPGRAVAYQRSDGPDSAWEQAMPFEDAYGNGGLLTTVGDLLIWNEALTSGRLGARMAQALQERASLSDRTRVTYGRGLFVDRLRDMEEISHGGATGGYRAWLGRYPAQKLSVALLCNAADVNSAALARSVADSVLGHRSIPVLPMPGAAAPSLAGLFVNQSTGIPMRLAVENGDLRIAGGWAFEFEAPARYRLDSGTIDLAEPNGFRLTTREGQVFDYRRAEPWTPSEADLQALAGLYSSDEAGAAYHVLVENGALILRHDRRPGLVHRLRPAYRDAFEIEGGIVRFERGRSGAAESLTIGLPRVRALRFTRSRR